MAEEHRRPGGLWPVWAVVALSLGITAILTLAALRHADSEAREHAGFAADEIEAKLLDRLGDHEALLHAAAAIVELRGEPSQAEWRALVRRMRDDAQVPGLQAVAYARLIPRTGLVAAEEGQRAAGLADFQVRPAGPRPVYSAIVLAEPGEGRNRRAYGYDMLTEPTRREAMERAWYSGQAALSGRVTLIHEEVQPQPGALLFVPVYRAGARVATVEERRLALLGWAFAPYRLGDLMNGILGAWQAAGGHQTRVMLHDGPSPSPGNLVFDSAPGRPAPGAGAGGGLVQERAIAHAGHAWTLRIEPTGAHPLGPSRAALVLVAGLVTTFLLGALMLVQLRVRERAEALAGQLTRDLRESEQRLGLVLRGSNQGLWDWDVASGRVTYDRRWAEMLGYRLEELEPHLRTWEKLVHPEDRPLVEKVLGAHLRGETPFYESEHRLQTREGAWKWILDRGLVVERDSAGRPLRAAGTHTDVDERRAAGEALAASERTHRELVSRLEESEKRYRSLFEHMREDVSVFTVVRDSEGRVVDWVLRESNAAGRAFFGDRYPSARGRPMTEIFGAEVMRPLLARSSEIMAGRAGWNEIFFPPAGRTYLAASFALDPETIVSVALDISDRRLAEERTRAALAANEKLVAELREALQNVKTLSGLLPICVYCKKIRDDRGYWERIEAYLTAHTGALFTHGMCPDCLKKNFP